MGYAESQQALGVMSLENNLINKYREKTKNLQLSLLC